MKAKMRLQAVFQLPKRARCTLREVCSLQIRLSKVCGLQSLGKPQSKSIQKTPGIKSEEAVRISVVPTSDLEGGSEQPREEETC